MNIDKGDILVIIFKLLVIIVIIGAIFTFFGDLITFFAKLQLSLLVIEPTLRVVGILMFLTSIEIIADVFLVLAMCEWLFNNN